MARPHLALNLFWRTFTWLALLLAGTVLAWQYTFKLLEAQPRALEAAEQLAGLVKLSRVALEHTDPINRVAVITSMSRGDTVQVRVAEPTDRWLPYDTSAFSKQLATELRQALGPETIVARSVNDQAGLWVRYTVGEDAFWLRTTPAPLSLSRGSNWWWVLIALLATVVGSALIARLINQPLRELAEAAGRIRDGEYDSRLDENTMTSEIREVNMGFNRMARELAKVEEDRAVMLAGISHDLRGRTTLFDLAEPATVGNQPGKQGMHP